MDAPDEQKPSKLESLTTWGRARSILMGSSRGRNLIVLGVFLFVMAAIVDIIQRVVGNSDGGISVAVIFVFAGVIAFIAGIRDYRSGY